MSNRTRYAAALLSLICLTSACSNDDEESPDAGNATPSSIDAAAAMADAMPPSSDAQDVAPLQAEDAIRETLVDLGYDAEDVTSVMDVLGDYVASADSLIETPVALDEGEYETSVIYFGDDCDAGFQAGSPPPAPLPPGAIAFNSYVFASSLEGFSVGITNPGENARIPDRPDAEYPCVADAFGFTCERSPSVFPAGAVGLPGSTAVATLGQTLRGFATANGQFVVLSKGSYVCASDTQEECDALQMRLSLILGPAVGVSLACGSDFEGSVLTRAPAS